LNSNINRVTQKEFFGCLGIDLCSVWWFVSFEFWSVVVVVAQKEALQSNINARGNNSKH
jgi:hypothetical protein